MTLWKEEMHSGMHGIGKLQYAGSAAIVEFPRRIRGNFE